MLDENKIQGEPLPNIPENYYKELYDRLISIVNPFLTQNPANLDQVDEAFNMYGRDPDEIVEF